MKNKFNMHKKLGAAVLFVTVMLSACSCSIVSKIGDDKNSVFGKDKDNTGTASAISDSSGENSGKNEERFDYASADMKEYIKIDTSVCKNMQLSISSEYIITDENVDEYIESLCFDKKVAVNEGKKVTNEPIKRGDTAYIFYKGTIDGKEFSGGSNMSSTTPHGLSIGSGSFIEGFEDGLIGVVPGETSADNMVELKLKFPDSYGNKEYAGKDVVFNVYVLYTIQYTIPEFDESFIKDVLKYEAKTQDVVSEYKAYAKEYLESQMQSYKDTAIENAMWEKLLDAATVIKYPEQEVTYYYDYYVSQFEYMMNYYQYMGYQFKDFNEFATQYMGLEDGADWRAELNKECKKTVAQDLIFHAIAQFDNVQITDEEYEAEIQSYIDYYKSSGTTYTREKVIEEIGESAIRETALYSKIVNGIIKDCEVSYN